MIDALEPSQEPSEEQGGQQGGLSSIQKLKLRERQARAEAEELRGALTSMRDEMTELRGLVSDMSRAKSPRSVADYDESDILAVASSEDVWADPKTAVQTIANLVDKKQDALAKRLKDEILGTVRTQAQHTDMTREVQAKIAKDFGPVDVNTELGGIAKIKLGEYLNRYARNQDPQAFLQQNPEYLYWSVRDAADELGLSRQSTIPRSQVLPDDQQEAGTEGTITETEAEQSAYDQAKKEGRTKDAFGMLAKRLLRGRR